MSYGIKWLNENKINVFTNDTRGVWGFVRAEQIPKDDTQAVLKRIIENAGESQLSLIYCPNQDTIYNLIFSEEDMYKRKDSKAYGMIIKKDGRVIYDSREYNCFFRRVERYSSRDIGVNQTGHYIDTQNQVWAGFPSFDYAELGVISSEMAIPVSTRGNCQFHRWFKQRRGERGTKDPEKFDVVYSLYDITAIVQAGLI